MSPSTEENPKHPTSLFSVIGGAFVPEERTDKAQPHSGLLDVTRSDTAAAFIWMIFYLVIIGVSIANSEGAAKLVEYATAMVK